MRGDQTALSNLHAPKSALQRAAGLSEADRELIRYLQVDGRTPISRLARQIEVPAHVLRRRLGELIEAGVIRIQPVVAYDALGLKAVATLGVTVSGRPAGEVARAILQVEAVNYLNVSAGRYDVFVGIACADLGELREIVDHQVRPIAGVQRVEVFPYLRRHYQEALFRRPRIEDLAPVRDGVIVDATDRALIAELGRDGRTALQRVADRLGMTEPPVRRRLQRLQRDGVVRVMAIVNPLSLGFEAMARLGVRFAPGRGLREVADAIEGVEAISYIALCAGRFDCFCEAACVDADELMQVVEQVRAVDGVAWCESFLFLEFFYCETPKTPRE